MSGREVVAEQLEAVLEVLLVDEGGLVSQLDGLQLRVGPGSLDLTGVVAVVDEFELWGYLGFRGSVQAPKYLIKSSAIVPSCNIRLQKIHLFLFV